MTAKIRIIEPVWRAVQAHHLDPSIRRERISYMFGRSFSAPDGTRTILVAEAPILFDDDCYLSQSGGHVSLDPIVLNAVFVWFAKSGCDVIINVHDHHFAVANTRFSPVDTVDELRVERYIRDRFEPMLERQPDIGPARRTLNVALVLDQQGCDARYLDGSGVFQSVIRIDIVGEHPRQIVPNTSKITIAKAPDPLLSRHADFIPKELQDLIAGFVFGIVGCGGLGSIVAEALLRLGATKFVLVDADDLEIHNLNRWQGGSPRNIGRNKADVLTQRLQELSTPRDVVVQAVPESAFSDKGQQALVACDAIIGGVDTHLARYFLNRLAIQYLVPYFDAGVNIVVSDHVDFQSRYVAVIPGTTACMECTAYELFHASDIERALMDDATARERRAAGYVENMPDIKAAASAYALNMRAVSALMLELENWFCGFRPLATCIMERWHDGHIQRSDRKSHLELPGVGCPACGPLIAAASHNELPRPHAEGRAARLLEQAREKLTVRSIRPSKETSNG